MSAPLLRTALDGIAIDLGGTKLAAARIAAGRIVDRAVCPTRSDAPAAEQVAMMHGLARQVGLANSLPVAIAVTGRVDAQGIWRAVNTGTLSNLADADLAALSADAFGRLVPLVNDAHAATFAEYHLGAGRGCDAMAYVTVSTGVGGGFVLGGRLLASANGLAGHFGFSTSRQAGALCGCGRTGTVESVAAGRAIAAEAIRQGQPVGSGREVFEHWQAGADWAGQIIDRSAAAVAELCGNLAAMLGAEAVVLGGSIGLAKGYADRVRTFLCREPALFRPDLRHAELGHDGVLLGALLCGQQT